MNNIARLAALLSLSTAALLASDTPSGELTLVGAPQQFSTTLGHVQKLTFRNVPGQCGKIYIGRSNMNTATLAGVIKILYPNCSGGIGDEYTIEDRTGADGINANEFYVAAGLSGETLLWDAYRTGVSAATKLVPYRVGPLLNANGLERFVPVLNPPVVAAIVEAYVVPGQSGKVNILLPAVLGYTGTLRKTLWPNTGQNISDGYRQLSPLGTNDFRADQFASSAWVPGEFPLVTVWRRQ